MSNTRPTALSDRATAPLTLLIGGFAAFAAYFAMYAFRKPFTAATYVDLAGWNFALDYKSALLIAQVLGYALSKLIGVKVISEFGRHGRAKAIFALISFSWVALILFALMPAPWNIICLFLNGLPLGMIWGLVFSYIEGRRVSELLGAMLCASFILSSGVVKSAAMLLLQAGVPEMWMPAAVGLLFVPVLLLALWWLERLPPPDALDELERSPRVPMHRKDRLEFMRKYGMLTALLVGSYVLLTAVRDVRDNFSAEIWAEMGFGGNASVFSTSEFPIAVITFCGLALLVLVRDNLRALMYMHAMIIGGALMLGAATFAFQQGLLSPLMWMILAGAGLYIAYGPFNALLFDRVIAVTGTAGNAGFLMYVADTSGYVGSVGLLLYRSFSAADVAWLPVFIGLSYFAAASVILLTLLSASSFLGLVHMRKSNAPA